MRFASPAALLLLPLLAVWFWRARSRSRPALLTGSLDPLLTAEAGKKGLRVRLGWLPAGVRGAVLVVLVIALARPEHGLAPFRPTSQGIDVVLVLDISGSMADPQGSGRSALPKFEAAKRALGAFVDTQVGSRIGFVVFRSAALVLSPLTTDHAGLHRAIDGVGADFVPALTDGTAIGSGISEALNLLRNSSAPSRAIVLATDGENNAGDVSPSTAAALAKALGIKLYTIGVLTGRGGDDVNAAELRQMAESTGATYHNAATPAELARAYQEIGTLQKSEVPALRYTRYDEYGPVLIAVGMAGLLTEVVLRVTLFRRYP